MLTCSIDGCEKRTHARTYCGMHYLRWRKHGDPLYIVTIPDVVTRFWAKVDKSGECWEWTGTTNYSGYGCATVSRHVRMTAHRLSAAIAFGMFDQRLQVLHRCDNRRCVRPEHLYLGTHADNMRDVVERRRHRAYQQESCKHGHPFDDENTRWYRTYRVCRECARRHVRNRRAREAAAVST